MFPETVQKAENIVRKAQYLLSKSMRLEAGTTENELQAIRSEYDSLSARVLAQRETNSCIEILYQHGACLSPGLTRSVNVKVHSLLNKLSEINTSLNARKRTLTLEKANFLISQGKLGEALGECEKILTTVPWDKDARNVLTTLARKQNSESLRTTIKKDMQKFRFNHLRSFGHRTLSVPHDINVSKDGTTLFVSDHGDNAVHRFDVNGEYLGECDTTLVKPRGIFNGENSMVWICDLEGQRLVGVTQQGRQVAEILLTDQLGKDCLTTYPCWGICHKGQIHLLLSDLHKQKFCHMRVSVDSHSIRKGEACIAVDRVGIPCGLGVKDNTIYVGSFTQGCLYFDQRDSGTYAPIMNETVLTRLKSFAIGVEGVFLNFGEAILKTTGNGETVFCANLSTCLGGKVCLNFGLSLLDRKKDNVLFAPDGRNKCIHVFSV